MIKMRKVLNPWQLPTQMPLQFSVLAYLLLDRWNGSVFVRWMVTLYLITLWVVWIVACMAEVPTSIKELEDDS